MKRLTLRTTLTLVYTGILAFLLMALGFASYHILALHLDLDATDDLEKMTGGLHGYLDFQKGMPVLVYNRNDPEEVAFIEAATRYYQVYDANSGRLLVQSTAFDPLGVHYTPAEVQTLRDRSRVYDMHTGEGRIRISSGPISTAPGEAYLLQVGLPLDPVDGALSRFVRLLLLSVPVGLLAAVVIGRWMAARALAPLARLAAAARTISVADLGQRLQVRGAGDELDEVADAFNETLGRLDQAVGEMKQFSAALAHELRTPLAVLRGETEFALLHARSPDEYRRGLTRQLEELDRLARLITQILTLARAEAGEIPLAREPVDLSALGAAVVEQLEPVAQAADVELTCEVSNGVVVTGDAGWLQRLLLNLIDNAIKFTPARGRISVRVSRDTVARLEVRDTGVGIAADALPHLFERFYRVDPARSRRGDGAGLGLALAKWIADRHGATIGVTSRPGDGSTFTVRLPLAFRAGSSPLIAQKSH